MPARLGPIRQPVAIMITTPALESVRRSTAHAGMANNHPIGEIGRVLPIPTNRLVHLIFRP